MQKPSYGSVLTCIVIGSVLMFYLIFLNKKTKFTFKYGTNAFLILALLLTARMFLPYNFIFTHNLLSTKILPTLYNAFQTTFFFHISIMDVFLCVWFVGILVKLVLLCIGQYKYSQFTKLQETLNTPNLDNIINKLNVTHHSKACITVKKAEFIKSPCITGLINPTVLLPDIDFSEKELEFILSHELEHYYHHDLWIKLFFEIMVCMYWWNPLVYLMKQQLETTLELSNDNTITQNMNNLERIEYLDCMLKVAKNHLASSKSSVLCFSEGKTSTLKERTQFILNNSSVKKNIFYYINIFIITGVVIASLVFVVEPDSLPKEVAESTVALNKDNAFIIKNGEHYDVYYNNKFFGTALSIESLEELKIYENREEAEKYEKIE